MAHRSPDRRHRPAGTPLGSPHVNLPVQNASGLLRDGLAFTEPAIRCSVTVCGMPHGAARPGSRCALQDIGRITAALRSDSVCGLFLTVLTVVAAESWRSAKGASDLDGLLAVRLASGGGWPGAPTDGSDSGSGGRDAGSGAAGPPGTRRRRSAVAGGGVSPGSSPAGSASGIGHSVVPALPVRRDTRPTAAGERAPDRPAAGSPAAGRAFSHASRRVTHAGHRV